MGTFSSLSAGALVSGIVLLVLGLNVFAVGLPLIQTAAGNVASTGAPLTSFFASNGIIILAIVGAMILAVLGIIGLTKGGMR